MKICTCCDDRLAHVRRRDGQLAVVRDMATALDVAMVHPRVLAARGRHGDEPTGAAGARVSRKPMAVTGLPRVPELHLAAPRRCQGWEVVCPDGHVRHFPYHNHGDARCDAEVYSERHDVCRDAFILDRPTPLQRCRGGRHVVRELVFRHAEVGEA